MSISSDPNATFDVPDVGGTTYTFRFPTSRQWRRLVAAMEDARSSMDFYDDLVGCLQDILAGWTARAKFDPKRLEDVTTFGEMVMLGNGVLERSTTAEAEKKRSELQPASERAESAADAPAVATTLRP